MHKSVVTGVTQYYNPEYDTVGKYNNIWVKIYKIVCIQLGGGVVFPYIIYKYKIMQSMFVYASALVLLFLVALVNDHQMFTMVMYSSPKFFFR